MEEPVHDIPEGISEIEMRAAYDRGREDRRFETVYREIRRAALLPGGLVGIAGLVIVLTVIVAELSARRLEQVEYVATIAIGAAMAVAGPLVVSSAAKSIHRGESEATVARSNARIEESKRVRAEIEARGGRVAANDHGLQM